VCAQNGLDPCWNAGFVNACFIWMDLGDAGDAWHEGDVTFSQ